MAGKFCLIFLICIFLVYETIANEDSEFKKQFKFYKRRDRPLNLSAALDPHKSSEVFNLNFNYVSDKCLVAVGKLIKGISGLRFVF